MQKITGYRLKEDIYDPPGESADLESVMMSQIQPMILRFNPMHNKPPFEVLRLSWSLLKIGQQTGCSWTFVSLHYLFAATIPKTTAGKTAGPLSNNGIDLGCAAPDTTR